jgi:hypothetical protein
MSLEAHRRDAFVHVYKHWAGRVLHSAGGTAPGALVGSGGRSLSAREKRGSEIFDIWTMTLGRRRSMLSGMLTPEEDS